MRRRKWDVLASNHIPKAGVRRDRRRKLRLLFQSYAQTKELSGSARPHRAGIIDVGKVPISRKLNTEGISNFVITANVIAASLSEYVMMLP